MSNKQIIFKGTVFFGKRSGVAGQETSVSAAEVADVTWARILRLCLIRSLDYSALQPGIHGGTSQPSPFTLGPWIG